MSSSFFDQLEAPITEADPANHFAAAAAEEPDMVQSVNAEVERVQLDRERQFENLIQIHNHMFEQKSKQWTDIQKLMGKAVEVKKSYDTYLEESSLSRIWKHSREHDYGTITAFAPFSLCILAFGGVL